MTHVMERNRRQGRARWMLDRVQNHFSGRKLAGLVKEYGAFDVNWMNFSGTTHFDEVVCFQRKLAFPIQVENVQEECFSDGTPVTCYRADIFLLAGRQCREH